jgi:hypothetical protein
VRLCAELRDVFGLAPGRLIERPFPRLGPAFLPHFARGLLEGGAPVAAASHGSHASAPWSCAFTAQSSAFVEQLRQAVDSQTGTRGDIGPSPMPRSNDAWSLRYKGTDAITVGR